MKLLFLILITLSIFAFNVKSQITINTCAELRAIPGNDVGGYVLGGNIDCSGETVNGALVPATLTVDFDGNDKEITGYSTSAPSTDNVGVFAQIGDGSNSPTVSDLKVVSANIAGQNNVGVVCGSFVAGTLQGVAVVTSMASGVNNVGGLVGKSSAGSAISQCSVLDTVLSGTENIAGAVGEQKGTLSEVSVSGGSMSGVTNIAGVSGFCGATTMTDTYSEDSHIQQSGAGTGRTGVIVGTTNGCTISNAFAASTMTRESAVNYGPVYGFRSNSPVFSNVYYHYAIRQNGNPQKDQTNIAGISMINLVATNPAPAGLDGANWGKLEFYFPRLVNIDDACEFDATGDPHFRPLIKDKKYQQFTFAAETDVDKSVYNLISNELIQFNALWTIYGYPVQYITESGITIRHPQFKNEPISKIKLFTSKSARTGAFDRYISVELNGVQIKLDENDFKTEIPIFSVEKNLYFIKRLSNERIVVVTPFFRVTTKLLFADAKKPLSKVGPMIPFFNNDFEVASLLEKECSGILGQTIGMTKPLINPPKRNCFHCWVRGDMVDYRIKGDDLFGTGFATNKF